jgi:ATP-dependent Clp protease ATP-binding subunit ClpC
MKKLKLYELFTGEEGEQQKTKKKTPFLDAYGVDMTKLAEDDKLDPVIGRQKEIDQVIWILSRKNKNNPVIIGEPGVGKTAIIEGIARLMVTEDCPEALEGKRIVSVDMGTIMAGQGGLEAKVKALMDELNDNPDIILFIDEIHLMVNKGVPIDMANQIKPALARGNMRLIGATTNNEFRNSIEKDGALERRFQKVNVEEPSIEDTIEILMKIKNKYEDFHKVSYNDDAIEACVTLSGRFISDRYFPDKAIDLMDEVGAKMRISAKKSTPPELIEIEKELSEIRLQKSEFLKAQKYQEAGDLRPRENELVIKAIEIKKTAKDMPRITITKEDVEKILSLKTGIPTQVTGDEGKRLLGLEGELKMQIIGQDDAVTKIAKSIRRNRAGLKDPNRPAGVFLFLGSTGTGKTHTVKTLAKNVFGTEDAMIRVDMSEYAEKHNVARMIGSPPGYVGYGEGGQLTEKVRRKPYCIILFDELEKAHPSVMDIMLQIFDDGHLTDGEGRKVDFRNTIIVMTSNIGASAVSQMVTPVGFGADKPMVKEENAKAIIKAELSKRLKPEFINRIDEIIIFSSLSKENIYKIIDIEIKKVESKLKAMNLSLEITTAFKDLLIDKGYDEKMGARPLKRAIQHYLEDPLSDEILGGELEGNVVVDYDPSSNKILLNGKPFDVNESKSFKYLKPLNEFLKKNR